ncbi:MAG: secondary thiamine-phosphate synthase enzyme YjbQ [Candidatus Thermoplasmatota archaeon]|nr:secondary thiamine-phosphate synthase enzyme YjbQ [Candidatus Thermoplasmatota archaeon]
MASYYEELQFSTKGENDMKDITNDIQQVISSSTLKEGIACVFVPGSTGSLTTIEFEPGLQKDFPQAMNEIAPKNKEYAHHETWHDDNGRSHVKASLMGPSVTLPFHQGKLIHGTWQQIIFIDFDTRPRDRKIIVQLIGEKLKK